MFPFILAATGLGRPPGLVEEMATAKYSGNQTIFLLGVLVAVCVVVHKLGLLEALRDAVKAMLSTKVTQWTSQGSPQSGSPAPPLTADVQQVVSPEETVATPDPEVLRQEYLEGLRKYPQEVLTSLVKAVEPDETRRANLALLPTREQPTVRKPVSDAVTSTTSEPAGAERAQMVAEEPPLWAYEEPPFDAYVEFVEPETIYAGSEDPTPQTAKQQSPAEDVATVDYRELFGVDA